MDNLNTTVNNVYIFGTTNGPVSAVNNGTMASVEYSSDNKEKIIIRPDFKDSNRKSHILLKTAFEIQMSGEYEKIISLVKQSIEAENEEISPDIHTLLYSKMFLVHYYLTDVNFFDEALNTIDEILAFDISKRDTQFYCTVLMEKVKLLAYKGKSIEARATLNLVEKSAGFSKNSLFYEVSGMVSFLEGNIEQVEYNYRTGMDNALGEYSTAVTQEERDSCYQHYWAFLTFLGDAYRKTQRPDLALTMWKKAVDISFNLHFEQKRIECLLAYSECLLQYEKWSEVCDCLGMASDTMRSIPNKDLKYQYYNLMASAFLGLNNSNSAIDNLMELLEMGLPHNAAISVLQRIVAIEASKCI